MSEHDEQRALFEWAALMERRVPELALLLAIPNGGHRHKAVAAKMRAEGQRAGVPDILLPVARRGYHGTWIEMKFGANKQTPAQREWDRRLTAQGYIVEVFHTWHQAAQHLIWYLGLNAQEFGL